MKNSIKHHNSSIGCIRI